MECTGKFNSKDKLLTHIKNGAKKVIVSAPCKNADKTIVFGVNENSINKKDKIISAASCTTNCLGPVIDTLNKYYSIEKAFMTTIILSSTLFAVLLLGTYLPSIMMKSIKPAAQSIVVKR